MKKKDIRFVHKAMAKKVRKNTLRHLCKGSLPYLFITMKAITTPMIGSASTKATPMNIIV